MTKEIHVHDYEFLNKVRTILINTMDAVETANICPECAAKYMIAALVASVVMNSDDADVALREVTVVVANAVASGQAAREAVGGGSPTLQ